MHVTDKITKKVLETKYLTADNVERYRSIMRIFYENYEKLKYWLYQEDIYVEMTRDEYFKEYRMEQCQQDLSMLVEWKNLITIQDTRKVASIEEFKNKKFRYQMSEYSVEIERLVLRLENLFIEGASLEPTLLERIRQHIMKLPQTGQMNAEATYLWWNDLNNDFIRLNQNYQDYIRDLNSVKAEEMMKTREFLLFKDKLTEYLRSFVKGLQRNVGIIEEIIENTKEEVLEQMFEKVLEYELSIPRIDVEVSKEQIMEKTLGRWESIRGWFVQGTARENEAGKLFDATNEIIRKITRYATQISEQNTLGANRREEYAKVASIFQKCTTIEEAHRLSAMVFGIENPIHLKGESVRETDSMNSSVFEERPCEIMLKPRIRTYREKTGRSAMKDYRKEKEQLRKEMAEMSRCDQEKVQRLVKDGRIDFSGLPVIEPRVREILLVWLADALETVDHRARTDDGRAFYLDMEHVSERCTVHCEDGNFTMPRLTLVFAEDEEWLN